MAIIIGKQEDIDDYFERPEVNQSSLKDLRDGLDAFLASIAKKRKDKEENKPTPDHFLIGGAVDLILTGEEGAFEDQYYVSTLEKKPSDVEISIIESVFHELASNNVINDLNFEDCPDAILAAANEVKHPDGKIGWQNNWKAETRINKLIIAGTDYFEDLKNSFGMKILTSEMKNKIDTIVNSLRKNNKTKKYFNRKLQAEQESMDFYYQLPIYFSYEGIECKALMDLVVVHKDKNGNITKIEPIDLKTMSGNTLQFIGKIKTLRYDIQAAWYTEALIKHFNVDSSIIEPFKFIVESTTSIGSPLVYRISENTLYHGKYGSEEGVFDSVNTYKNKSRYLFYPEVKGFSQLIKDYSYYANQGFREDIIRERNGDNVIEVDWIRGIIS